MCVKLRLIYPSCDQSILSAWLTDWITSTGKRITLFQEEGNKHTKTYTIILTHTSSTVSKKVRCWLLTSELDHQLHRQGGDLRPLCVCVSGFVWLLTPGLCQSTRFLLSLINYLSAAEQIEPEGGKVAENERKDFMPFLKPSERLICESSIGGGGLN